MLAEIIDIKEINSPYSNFGKIFFLGLQIIIFSGDILFAIKKDFVASRDAYQEPSELNKCL